MNNDYKWETIGRCKFYTDGTTCTDIEVMDDAKVMFTFVFRKYKKNVFVFQISTFLQQ